MEVSEHPGFIDVAEEGDCTRPEHSSHHRSVLQDCLALRGNRIQPGRDEGLQGVRELCFREVLREPASLVHELAVSERSHQLLGVERISSRPLQERGSRLGGKRGNGEEVREEPGCLLLRQRGDRDDDRVAHPRTPRGMAVVELWTRRRHHHERDRRDVLGEVLQEFEHGTVGPVRILHDEDQRLPPSRGLQEPPPGREGLLPINRVPYIPADQWGQSGQHPGPLGGVGHESVEERGKLPFPFDRCIRSQDSGLVFHDLPESPERDAFTVGKASTTTPLHRGLGCHSGKGGAELPDQTTLPHASLTDDGHQLCAVLGYRSPEYLLE